MSVGRNDPCPCGSGLKYKKCCLLKETQERALDMHAEQMIAAKSAMLGELRSFAVLRLSEDEFKETWLRYRVADSGSTSRYTPESTDDEVTTPPLHKMLEDIPYFIWLFLDCRDEEENRLVEAFANSGEVEDEDELELVRSVAKATLSPYIVESVERDCRVTLRPLFGGETVELFDRYIARMISKDQVITTRLFSFDGRLHMIGVATMLGPGLRAELRRRLETAYDQCLANSGQERDWHTFFAREVLTTTRIVVEVRAWATQEQELR